MGKSLLKSNLELYLFSFFKVPMLFYCRPRIIALNDEKVEIKLPLRRRTKNHLNSMYFGALAVGADVAGGFIAFDQINKSGEKISLVFKDFKADFLKRPEAAVHFLCEDGLLISKMIEETLSTKERVSNTVRINAFCPSISDEIVAEFSLGLSLKVKSKH